MTVIAWDGRYVAADKQSTQHGSIQTVTKLYVDGRKVYALCGVPDHGLMMIAWLKSGAALKDHPTEMDNNRNAFVYVFEWGKHPLCYEFKPLPMIVEDPIMAAGSGRDYAVAVLEMGGSVERAVEIASKWDSTCGQGVDVFDLKELAGGRSAGHEPTATVAGRATPVFPQ